MKIGKHSIWATALTLIVVIICATCIYLNSHPYIFEIGDNALEGIKSMNWTAISEAGKSCSCNC